MDWTTRGSVVGWQLIRKYIWYQDFTKPGAQQLVRKNAAAYTLEDFDKNENMVNLGHKIE